MPAISLGMDPDLGQLAKRARELQRAVRSGDPAALALVAEFHPGSPPDATFQLSAAQCVLARQYGFASWPRLRQHVETSATWQPGRPAAGEDLPAAFLRLSCGGYARPTDDRARDLRQARDLLASHPGLPAQSVAVAAACADAGAVRRHLAGDPSLATAGSEPFGWPPLPYLAYARHDGCASVDATLQTARLLLDAGADPDEGRFWHGLPQPVTVLSGAIGSKYTVPEQETEAQYVRALAFARLLLEAGADPDDGSIGMAEDQADDGILELLFEFGLGRGTGGRWRQLLGDHAGRDRDGRTVQLRPVGAEMRFLLFGAIERNNRSRVALLARHGVDLASPFTDMRQFFASPHRWPEGVPAAVALVNGNHEMARLLAELGAPLPGPASPDGFVAAAMTGDAAAVRAADPAAVTAVRSLWPGLPVWAASRGVLESVPLLVEAGFDVNAFGRSDGPFTEPRWHSALHVAAGNGDLALAQRLLDAGADPDIRRPSQGSFPGGGHWELELPDEEATPADWARRKDHRAMVDLLDRARRRRSYAETSRRRAASYCSPP